VNVVTGRSTSTPPTSGLVSVVTLIPPTALIVRLLTTGRVVLLFYTPPTQLEIRALVLFDDSIQKFYLKDHPPINYPHCSRMC